MRNHATAPLIALCLLASPSIVHAAPPKACDLLGAQTAASLLGTPVGTPVDVKNGGGCTYTSRTGGATVSLAVADSGTDGVQTVVAMQVMASREQGATTKSIPGLGEQSFLATRTSNKNFIMLVYHQKTVVLAVQRPMTPDLEKTMVQTVRQVLTKL
jgi:hypothetical protein